MFDPTRIADDTCGEGHLDVDPIYQVLLAIGKSMATGRLTIADAAGENHMYFMQGRPVGVHLAEHFHPLGQLLLELGRMSGAQFVKAQRLIAEGNRLPGQVYKEMGILDDLGLKEVLGIQARRKAEHFCRLGSRPFQFCRGLTFLTGFTSTPLDAHAVIFLAVRQQMGEQAREAWLEAARGDQVRLVPPGPPIDPDKPVENFGLPAALPQYGFGPPEERFLQRILVGWESVPELAETGTLPRDEMSVLLRYLEVIGRLQRRPIPAAVPSPASKGQAPMEMPPLTPRPPEIAALQGAPLAEPTSDDVFSRPKKPLPSEEPLFAEPDAPTDPRRPAVVRSPSPDLVFASNAAAPPGVTSAALHEPTPPLSQPLPSVVVDDEMPAPVVKKKKVKRTEPLPSEGSGVMVSETRREKTQVTPLPSIVIEED